MTAETPAVSVPVRVRLGRFLLRVVIALAVTGWIGAFIARQADRAETERYFDYPLLVALDQVGAAVQATRISAAAELGRGSEPTMEELKALADRLVRTGPGAARAELWSEVHPQYRVVYYRGRDEAGGTWTVSARYVAGAAGEPGSVELAIHRDLIGRFDGIRSALQQLRGRLLAAAGRPLSRTELSVRLEARPRSADDPDALVSALLDAVGARNVERTLSGGSVTATGWTPRLAAHPGAGAQAANVTIELSRRGQGAWLVVASPSP